MITVDQYALAVDESPGAVEPVVGMREVPELTSFTKSSDIAPPTAL